MLTLTYVYADQTAVLGPLATYAEPHAYDLCEAHGERLSAPRGWEVLRLPVDQVDHGPSEDDLLALADAVREAGAPRLRPSADERRPVAVADPVDDPRPLPHAQPGLPHARQAPAARESTRRGHLRVLAGDPGPDGPGDPVT